MIRPFGLTNLMDRIIIITTGHTCVHLITCDYLQIFASNKSTEFKHLLNQNFKHHPGQPYSIIFQSISHSPHAVAYESAPAKCSQFPPLSP